MRDKPFGLTIAFGLFICTAKAQIKPDTLAYSEAAKQVVAEYNNTIGDQSEIYSGAQYYLYPTAYKGSAYFDDKTFLTPSLIRYNGTWYQDVPIIYDMYTDEMVSSQQNILFVLRNEKLSDVYLLGHHFVYLDAQQSRNLDAGYYDELYQGRSQVLVKRLRTVQNTVTQQAVEVTYENKDVVYLKKGDAYYPVNSEGSALAIFKDKKKQLKQYLSTNHIKYRKDKEGSIVKLASYYDQITN